MRQETHYIIFKSDDRYSITECGETGVKKAYLTPGNVSGDRDVLLKLSRIVPVDETIRSFVERHSGRLICIDDSSTTLKCGEPLDSLKIG